MTGYTYLWEFHVVPAQQERFEFQYGPEGGWAALFHQARGYRESRLLRDHSNSLRYVTVDRWETEADYRAFQAQFSRQYDELDRECHGLTTHEALLGECSE